MPTGHPPPPTFDIERPDLYDRDQLIEMVSQIRKDWAILNDILNSRANAQRWCATWEYNQIAHNRNFKILRLTPRPGYGDYWNNTGIGESYTGPTTSWKAQEPF